MMFSLLLFLANDSVIFWIRPTHADRNRRTESNRFLGSIPRLYRRGHVSREFSQSVCRGPFYSQAPQFVLQLCRHDHGQLPVCGRFLAALDVRPSRECGRGWARLIGTSASDSVGLALVAIVVYQGSPQLPKGAAFDWQTIKQLGVWGVFAGPLKHDWFQTLMHIAVTSLWILPVIRAGWVAGGLSARLGPDPHEPVANI